MKVLTLHQPWASLIALGVKTIVTPSWSTKYRGPLAIHASARVPGFGLLGDIGEWWHGKSAYVEGEWVMCRENREGDIPLPLGAIVATCTLVDVVPICQRNGNFVQESPAEITCWPSGKLTYWRANAHPLDVTHERPYGDFTPGRYAWLLADIKPVDPPVPFKGGQGLTRTWEPEAVPA